MLVRLPDKMLVRQPNEYARPGFEPVAVRFRGRTYFGPGESVLLSFAPVTREPNEYAKPGFEPVAVRFWGSKYFGPGTAVVRLGSLSLRGGRIVYLRNPPEKDSGSQ